MGQDLQVGFEDLDSAAATIKARAVDIEDKLDAMEKRMLNRKPNWTGAASDAFDEARIGWEAAMSDMKEVLNDIGVTVSLSNADYQAAESANASRFRV